MREKVLRFGENRSLVGVVCEPAGGPADQDATALLFINSGLVHRVGPSRLYVNAARALSKTGVLTMRFDLSGVGDSEQRNDTLSFEERSTIEIRQAMDVLEARFGVRRFILTGICSGADNAFDVAVLDPRVIGIIPVDYHSFSSTGYLLHSYKRRLVSLRSWGKLLTGSSELWGVIKKLFKKKMASPDGGSDLPSKENCIEKFRVMAQRGTHLCLVYSGTSPAYYNYRIHFCKGLQSTKFEGQFRVVYFDSADHIFTTIQQQDNLIQTIQECVRDFVQNARTPSTT